MKKEDQSASTKSEPVTEGQSDTLVSVTKNYPGGKDKLELARANPNFRKRIWGVLDELAAEQAIRLPLIERPVWMTIKRSCNDAKSYISALESAGCEIGDWARDIMNKPAFMVGFEIDSVELMSATTQELTDKSQAPRSEIYDGAQRVGWDKVPAWVGPELRLQYLTQPKDEWRIVGMEPIVDSDGRPFVFGVEHDGCDRWLDGRYDGPGDVWNAASLWVFGRRK